VKQDQAEAKGNVDKRLEFIRGEMSVSMDVLDRDYAHTVILQETDRRTDTGNRGKIGKEKVRGGCALSVVNHLWLMVRQLVELQTELQQHQKREGTGGSAAP
jgi:hypothetical protein